MKYKKMWESAKATNPKIIQFIETFNKVPNDDLMMHKIVREHFEVMSELGETRKPEVAEAYAIQLFFNEPLIDSTKEYTLSEFYEYYVDNLEIRWSYIDENNNIIRGTRKKDLWLMKGHYRALNEIMDMISCRLYVKDHYFKPIFFANHFDWIQRNCELLGIKLPDIPRTNDYRKYTMYYLDICETFAQFQEENEMTDAEFLCYLYLFADLQIDEPEPSELPRPTNVWLTGANPWDWEELEKGAITKSAWACNEMTQRGDIVIVYAVTPHSCFHSIWRADSGGCFNPFCYYHCRTTVVDCHPIPHVTHTEFMSDPILSDFTIGRKSLQGVNGFRLSAQEYSSFLEYLSNKGADITTLPKLVTLSNWTHPTIEGPEPEKQVENKYIKPLLENILGYKPEDYTQQARHKSGRKEKSIPDFVFFQSGEHGLEHCPFLIEAKVDFKGTRQRRKDYEQGLSYAQTYHAKVMSIMDRHRVIVYKVDNNGVADYNHPAFEQQWEVIYSDTKVQAELISLIGREVIINIK